MLCLMILAEFTSVITEAYIYLLREWNYYLGNKCQSSNYSVFKEQGSFNTQICICIVLRDFQRSVPKLYFGAPN